MIWQREPGASEAGITLQRSIKKYKHYNNDKGYKTQETTQLLGWKLSEKN